MAQCMKFLKTYWKEIRTEVCRGDTNLNSAIIHSIYINWSLPWISEIVNPCTHSYWVPHIHSAKLLRRNLRHSWPQVEVLIDNEAGNTKSTHLSKTYYLHDIKQQWNLWQWKALGHPIACTTGGDISLQILNNQYPPPSIP